MEKYRNKLRIIEAERFFAEEAPPQGVKRDDHGWYVECPADGAVGRVAAKDYVHVGDWIVERSNCDGYIAIEGTFFNAQYEPDKPHQDYAAEQESIRIQRDQALDMVNAVNVAVATARDAVGVALGYESNDDYAGRTLIDLCREAARELNRLHRAESEYMLVAHHTGNRGPAPTFIHV